VSAERADAYRPFRVLPWWLVGLMLVSLALNIGLSGLELLVALRHPTLTDAGTSPAAPTELALLLSVVGVGLAYLAVLLACVVLFCVWLHRVNRNARALGAAGMEYTPGLAVAWFFVPLFNLFKPYYAVKEVYQASGPDVGAEGDGSGAPSTRWSDAPVPLQLRLWWLTWIGSNLLDSASLRFSLENADARSAWLGVAGALVMIPCTLFATWLVLEIGDRQALRAERVARTPDLSSLAEAAPGPTFPA
jgi:hypothetical protein